MYIYIRKSYKIFNISRYNQTCLAQRICEPCLNTVNFCIIKVFWKEIWGFEEDSGWGFLVEPPFLVKISCQNIL